MNLNAFLRSSDATQCQSVDEEHFLWSHCYGWFWPCCLLINNTSFPSTNYWQSTGFFLWEASEIYQIFTLCCWSVGVNHRNPCLKVSIKWVCCDMAEMILYFKPGPWTWWCSPTSWPYQANRSTLPLLPSLGSSHSPLSHFTENIWLLSATTQRALW